MRYIEKVAIENLKQNKYLQSLFDYIEAELSPKLTEEEKKLNLSAPKL